MMISKWVTCDYPTYEVCVCLCADVVQKTKKAIEVSAIGELIK